MLILLLLEFGQEGLREILCAAVRVKAGPS